MALRLDPRGTEARLSFPGEESAPPGSSVQVPQRKGLQANRTLSIPLCLCAVLLLLQGSCENPFAPPLGDATSLWTDQSTVGGLLENFRSAYIHRDSLRYAECLACPDYQFNYFNTELGEYEMMPRETDLVSTGRLFRHYSEVDLRWVGLGDELAALDTPDSLIAFTLLFELRLDQDVITGHANFSVIKAAPVVEFCQSPIFEDAAVFRIIQWDDDL